jgi:hypothetical protein
MARPLHFAVSALLVAMLAAPTVADARPLRIFGVGLGTDVGYQQNSGYRTDSRSGLVSELELQLDMFYVFGLELSYNVGDVPDPSEHSGLVFDARYRLSGLLYVIPTDSASMYLKGGVGAYNIGDVAATDSIGNSYHAGAGVEIYLTEELAIAAEFLLLAPGAQSVERVLNDRKEAVEARFGQAFSSLSTQDIQEVAGDQPEMSGFLNPENFQAKLGVRLYF